MIEAHKIKPLSREQYDYVVGSHAQINIAHGPVRSGKNFAENLRMLHYLRREPIGDPRSTIAFCGASVSAVEDIFLNDLLDMVGPAHWTYDKSKGRGTIYGRPFRIFPCQKAGDYKRLRGRTLGGALLTEGTLCEKEFFNELLARLSIEGAKLFVDTNPSGPFHWLYTDFIANEEKLATGRVRAFQFNFDSNLSLSEDYKDGLKLFYGPGTLWYQRMIQGLWVMADGVIYAGFSRDKNTLTPEQLPRTFENLFSMGLDYGTANPFGALIGGQHRGKWYITREHYYDGRKQGQRSDQQHADALISFITQPLSHLYLDPSAASFKAELEQRQDFQRLGIWIADADNEVLTGIALLNSLITRGDLIFSTDCENAIREIGSYCWDPNAQKRGEDKPKKDNDHLMDAGRYLIKSSMTGYDPFAGWAA